VETETFQIAPRFCGPPRSGNGGYVCGRVARHLPGAAAVRLKAPPPLEVDLRLESREDGARLFQQATVIAEARCLSLELEVPPSPGLAQAEQAARSCFGFLTHPFPRCFVCGPQRLPGDGLRIFPGAVGGGSAVLAAPWLPDASLADPSGQVRSEFLWSALDCTGAFALLPRPEGQAIVLCELAAAIDGPLASDERCIAVAWRLGGEGRRHFAGSAVYTEHGRLVARARAVWVEVEARLWN
jgi:hypothetical protein